MQGPRDEILRELKTRGGLFASEIATAVGTGTSAVRPHLDRLSADNLIEAEVVRGGPGRPRYRYRLTEKGHELFARGYRDLAMTMVDAVLEIGGRVLLDRVFERQEQKLIERYAGRVDGLPFDARIREVAAILDECGYMTQIERTETGYMLSEHNCPVSRVAGECHSACESERRLIARLCDAEVHLAHISPTGDTPCRYEVRAPREAVELRPAAAAR
jgi:predicted ArsR family transcriptional regulator